jgi:hypothetical protein
MVMAMFNIGRYGCMIQDPCIIQIYTIIVPPNAHKCIELGDIHKLADIHSCVYELILIHFRSFVGTINVYIPIDLQVIGCECGLDPSGLKIQWQAVVGTVMNFLFQAGRVIS